MAIFTVHTDSLDEPPMQIISYTTTGQKLSKKTSLQPPPLPSQKLKNTPKKTSAKKDKNKSHSEHLRGTQGVELTYELSGRGNRLLLYEGHKYIKNNEHGTNIYWKCTKWHGNCKARAITSLFDKTVIVLKNVHNHDAFELTKSDDVSGIETYNILVYNKPGYMK